MAESWERHDSATEALLSSPSMLSADIITLRLLLFEKASPSASVSRLRSPVGALGPPSSSHEF